MPPKCRMAWRYAERCKMKKIWYIYYRKNDGDIDYITTSSVANKRKIAWEFAKVGKLICTLKK